ncbi:MAG: hypothetical protein ACRD7E_18645, partial [Bryobacteraceae bacterium]
LKDDGSAAARRFHERVQNPLLTDISIEWNGLPVSEVYPKRVPDLFSAKPLVITGRFTAPAQGPVQGPVQGMVKLHGKVAGQPVVRDIKITLPANEPRHDVLATLWARTKIDDLMHGGANTRDEITQLGLDFRLMTPFTSFVAVEEMTITEGGQPRRIEVPVELPEGVSYEGVFGSGEMQMAGARGGPAGARMSYTGVKRAVMTPTFAAPMEKREVLDSAPASKLDPKLTGAEAAKLARNGKVEVRVWLNEVTPAVLAEMKKLGFEVIAQPKTAKVVVGRIAVEKLEALSRLTIVKYIAPGLNM